jgi:hypothetical protein
MEEDDDSGCFIYARCCLFPFSSKAAVLVHFVLAHPAPSFAWFISFHFALFVFSLSTFESTQNVAIRFARGCCGWCLRWLQTQVARSKGRGVRLE